MYAHDRVTGATTLVDTAWNGAPGDNDCIDGVSISADGSWVAWNSFSNNLVAGDAPFCDVFVRQRAIDPPTTFCRPKVNSRGCSSEIAWSGTPSVGSGLPFTLTASNMIGASTGVFFYALTP